MSEWKQAGAGKVRPYVAGSHPSCKGSPRGARSWVFVHQIADKPSCKYCGTPWPSTADVVRHGKNGKGAGRRDRSVDAAQSRKERSLEKQVVDLKKQLQEAKDQAQSARQPNGESEDESRTGGGCRARP